MKRRYKSKRAAAGERYQKVEDYLPAIAEPLEMLRRLVRLGLTNKELAEFYGVAENTFKGLVSENEEIRTLIETERMRPNHLVEQSLFKRAVGFHSKEITFQNGRPTKFLVREVFPDVTAQIFWLKNRSPERWRDAVEHKHTLRDRMAMIHGLQRGEDPKKLNGKKDEDDVVDAKFE